MAHKKSSMTDIALRVAMAMKQMGIDGLPRNYELVYEAYAGSNPDLVRDFIALGKYKTQAALDELGRKYLPHQHEASVLQRSAGAISNEMSNFMDLLTQERSSLNDYGRLIGEASQVIRNAGGLQEDEAVAANPGHLRLTDPQQDGPGNGGIHRVATPLQRFDGDLCCQRV